MFGKIGRAETATDPAPLSMVGDDDPAQAPRRMADASQQHALVFELGAPRPSSACWARSGPRSAPMTTAELIDRLDRTTRVPGWTNAWTAPVRARIDMMSTGVRTPVGDPHRRRRPRRGWTRWARRCGAPLLRVPGTRSAVYEGLGGETAGSPRRRARASRGRPGARAPRIVDHGGRGAAPSPDLCSPAAPWASWACRTRARRADDGAAAAPRPHVAAAVGWQRRRRLRDSKPARISAARWHAKPPDAAARRAVRGGDGASRSRWRCSGAPAFVDRARAAAHRARRARRATSTSTSTRAPTSTATSRARGATSSGALASRRAPPGGRRAHRVDRAIPAADRRPAPAADHRARSSRC